MYLPRSLDQQLVKYNIGVLGQICRTTSGVHTSRMYSGNGNLRASATQSRAEPINRRPRLLRKCSSVTGKRRDGESFEAPNGPAYWDPAGCTELARQAMSGIHTRHIFCPYATHIGGLSPLSSICAINWGRVQKFTRTHQPVGAK